MISVLLGVAAVRVNRNSMGMPLQIMEALSHQAAMHN
eukprot:CAMPEP_0119566166 /NCGR_PEP_ID=MMETSP1352-20130426/32315_1 /TAXON_ID=265584 /ORGANISM="Stauroneis constricta, Strain CCMP1120" /LENGTH=36 /DNA_ID= /DNA_START= /DNA_END= /DNA_ORIENTATION=